MSPVYLMSKMINENMKEIIPYTERPKISRAHEIEYANKRFIEQLYPKNYLF